MSRHSTQGVHMRSQSEACQQVLPLPSTATATHCHTTPALPCYLSPKRTEASHPNSPLGPSLPIATTTHPPARTHSHSHSAPLAPDRQQLPSHPRPLTPPCHTLSWRSFSSSSRSLACVSTGLAPPKGSARGAWIAAPAAAAGSAGTSVEPRGCRLRRGRSRGLSGTEPAGAQAAELWAGGWQSCGRAGDRGGGERPGKRRKGK